MWNYITEFYNEHIESQADPRIQQFPLMDSPRTTIMLVGLYLIFVKMIGPAYMKNRKPFEIRGLIIAFNAFQALFSLNIFMQASWSAWNMSFNILCQPQDYNRTDYYTSWYINVSWWFFIGRFIEFIDTILFILRKKSSQVNTLHVVHHSTVPLICWLGMKIGPGGHYTFGGWLNSFVHCFMYVYYMLAAMGPQYKKYLWWKQYMTIMQLGQFIIVFLHTVWTLASGCNASKIMGYIVLCEAMFFYKLFWDFYKNVFKNSSKNIQQTHKIK